MEFDPTAQVEITEFNRRDGVRVHAEHVLGLQITVGNTYTQENKINVGKLCT